MPGKAPPVQVEAVEPLRTVRASETLPPINLSSKKACWDHKKSSRHHSDRSSFRKSHKKLGQVHHGNSLV